MRKFVAKISVGFLALLSVGVVAVTFPLEESLDKQSQLLEPSVEDGVYKLVGVTSKGMLSQIIPSMFTPIGLYSELDPIRSLIDRNLANWE